MKSQAKVPADSHASPGQASFWFYWKQVLARACRSTGSHLRPSALTALALALSAAFGVWMGLSAKDELTGFLAALAAAAVILLGILVLNVLRAPVQIDTDKEDRLAELEGRLASRVSEAEEGAQAAVQEIIFGYMHAAQGPDAGSLHSATRDFYAGIGELRQTLPGLDESDLESLRPICDAASKQLVYGPKLLEVYATHVKDLRRWLDSKTQLGQHEQPLDL